MKDDDVDPVLWIQLSETVARHMGLHFPPERHRDLERGVRSAAEELGLPDAAHYARQLITRPFEGAQQQVLARHLTIGETYFFRDPQLLEALSRHVLPELIQRRRGHDQRLRIWSAACASGEEPYTLAILLHRLLPDIADWRITIKATDINPDALGKAATGLYGEWSFRNVPVAWKQGWFQRTTDGRYQVAPALRRLVSFELLNLVDDVYPSTTSDLRAMDLVFCRNVLMYFTRPQIERVVARLHDTVAQDGWLAVSPSEVSQHLFPQFDSVNFPGASLYCKRAGAVRTPVALPLHISNGAASAAPTLALPTAAQLARSCADEGNLVEALSWCDRWIASDKLEAAAHYLRAVIRIEQGELEDARASLRRTVFLEPGFVLAHFALGNLARREECEAEAARHFANVQHLLKGYLPGDQLPQGDGLTAGRLGQILGTTPHAVAP